MGIKQLFSGNSNKKKNQTQNQTEVQQQTKELSAKELEKLTKKVTSDPENTNWKLNLDKQHGSQDHVVNCLLFKVDKGSRQIIVKEAELHSKHPKFLLVPSESKDKFENGQPKDTQIDGLYFLGIKPFFLIMPNKKWSFSGKFKYSLVFWVELGKKFVYDIADGSFFDEVENFDLIKSYGYEHDFETAKNNTYNLPDSSKLQLMTEVHLDYMEAESFGKGIKEANKDWDKEHGNNGWFIFIGFLVFVLLVFFYMTLTDTIKSFNHGLYIPHTQGLMTLISFLKAIKPF